MITERSNSTVFLLALLSLQKLFGDEIHHKAVGTMANQWIANKQKPDKQIIPNIESG